VPRLLFRRIRQREVRPEFREVFIVGWAGMRGVVSLAAALALEGYSGFPRGHLVQFLAFSVILTTLVFQGLTLPPLIRYLGVGDDGSAAREEMEARTKISDAVMAKIAEAREERKYAEAVLDAVENSYRERALILNDDLANQLGWSDQKHHYVNVRRLRRAMVHTQRQALLALRRSGLIGDDVMHKIEHELDLDEARLKT
jgi:CPA1 family monovalent cation:H+ antiporter